MIEMFKNWEVWQTALFIIGGSVWLAFIVLDIRRGIAAKKRKAEQASGKKHETR